MIQLNNLDDNIYSYGIMWTIMYVDATNGDLKYANCSINKATNGFKCDKNVIDSIGVNAYGVFPEMDYYPTLNEYPVLVYIDQSNNITSALKVTQCNSLLCDNPSITSLGSGESGYGRDSSLAWNNDDNILYVSFLDYNGGKDKIARLLVVSAM
mmetsp:Transcript_83174/g.101925  ORF Transcript_83174/g.101925 Transcript_83174/m.101925 type:complete len:154 (-) Transcript_83174:613-1074(-)